MRVVLDTNTVVSGFLWDSQPRALIDAAVDERIELFTCATLIEELAGILPRRQFTSYTPSVSAGRMIRKGRPPRGHFGCGHGGSVRRRSFISVMTAACAVFLETSCVSSASAS